MGGFFEELIIYHFQDLSWVILGGCLKIVSDFRRSRRSQFCSDMFISFFFRVSSSKKTRAATCLRSIFKERSVLMVDSNQGRMNQTPVVEDKSMRGGQIGGEYGVFLQQQHPYKYGIFSSDGDFKLWSTTIHAQEEMARQQQTRAANFTPIDKLKDTWNQNGRGENPWLIHWIPCLLTRNHGSRGQPVIR